MIGYSRLTAPLLLLALLVGCDSGTDAPTAGGDSEYPVRLVTVDPGHFHAGLVHKYAYEGVDPTVHVYAPEGPDVERHLAMVEGFNSRDQDPTSWSLIPYTGPDYLERMLEERRGNVMVTAGNNARKIDYVSRAVDAGIHVLADKPMIIRPEDFEVLGEVLRTADAGGVLVYDIMTERHEITSMLQAELSRVPAVFGEIVPGSPDDPAISKESVHFLSKKVAGSQLVRPAWFLDVGQQGEAIVDVSTHLVDLVLWQLFPQEPIDFEGATDGIEVLSARSWDTELTPAQFERITTQRRYPEYLLPYMREDSTLQVAANGEFTFVVRGVHAGVSVRWGFENPGGGDTHFSRLRGTHASLTVRQDEAQGFRPTLYVESGESADPDEVRAALESALAGYSDRWPDLAVADSEFGFEIVVPDALREGHEEHFARVTEQFLEYLEAGKLPDWERANLLTKYWITTQAYGLAH